eukprot:TRINITY_DN5730_c0_g2_i1.p1 TRINITY_DN5730_c0_g2~~TRINITY_DN5730_c0_g2_i1.p1  ORF type:complete len:1440 (+),score=330.59 TRINITY_DN5730_c0_g2_i1:127-4446(+)
MAEALREAVEEGRALLDAGAGADALEVLLPCDVQTRRLHGASHPATLHAYWLLGRACTAAGRYVRGHGYFLHVVGVCTGTEALLDVFHKENEILKTYGGPPRVQSLIWREAAAAAAQDDDEHARAQHDAAAKIQAVQRGRAARRQGAAAPTAPRPPPPAPPRSGTTGVWLSSKSADVLKERAKKRHARYVRDGVAAAPPPPDTVPPVMIKCHDAYVRALAGLAEGCAARARDGELRLASQRYKVFREATEWYTVLLGERPPIASRVGHLAALGDVYDDMKHYALAQETWAKALSLREVLAKDDVIPLPADAPGQAALERSMAAAAAREAAERTDIASRKIQSAFRGFAAVERRRRAAALLHRVAAGWRGRRAVAAADTEPLKLKASDVGAEVEVRAPAGMRGRSDEDEGGRGSDAVGAAVLQRVGRGCLGRLAAHAARESRENAAADASPAGGSGGDKAPAARPKPAGAARRPAPGPSPAGEGASQGDGSSTGSRPRGRAVPRAPRPVSPSLQQQHEAATKIQALRRGQVARAAAQKERAAGKEACKAKAHGRFKNGSPQTSPVETSLSAAGDAGDAEHRAATRIQAAERGRRVRQARKEEQKRAAAVSGSAGSSSAAGTPMSASLGSDPTVRTEAQKMSAARAAKHKRDEEERAATRIQAIQRGAAARRKYRRMRLKPTPKAEGLSQATPENVQRSLLPQLDAAEAPEGRARTQRAAAKKIDYWSDVDVEDEPVGGRGHGGRGATRSKFVAAPPAKVRVLQPRKKKAPWQRQQRLVSDSACPPPPDVVALREMRGQSVCHELMAEMPRFRTAQYIEHEARGYLPPQQHAGTTHSPKPLRGGAERGRTRPRGGEPKTYLPVLRPHTQAARRGREDKAALCAPPPPPPPDPAGAGRLVAQPAVLRPQLPHEETRRTANLHVSRRHEARTTEAQRLFLEQSKVREERLGFLDLVGVQGSPRVPHAPAGTARRRPLKRSLSPRRARTARLHNVIHQSVWEPWGDMTCMQTVSRIRDVLRECRRAHLLNSSQLKEQVESHQWQSNLRLLGAYAQPWIRKYHTRALWRRQCHECAQELEDASHRRVQKSYFKRLKLFWQLRWWEAFTTVGILRRYLADGLTWTQQRRRERRTAKMVAISRELRVCSNRAVQARYLHIWQRRRVRLLEAQARERIRMREASVFTYEFLAKHLHWTEPMKGLDTLLTVSAGWMEEEHIGMPMLKEVEGAFGTMMHEAGAERRTLATFEFHKRHFLRRVKTVFNDWVRYTLLQRQWKVYEKGARAKMRDPVEKSNAADISERRMVAAVLQRYYAKLFCYAERRALCSDETVARHSKYCACHGVHTLACPTYTQDMRTHAQRRWQHVRAFAHMIAPPPRSRQSSFALSAGIRSARVSPAITPSITPKAHTTPGRRSRVKIFETPLAEGQLSPAKSPSAASVTSTIHLS